MNFKIVDNNNDYFTKSVYNLTEVIQNRTVGISEDSTEYAIVEKGYKGVVYSCIDAIAKAVAKNGFKLRIDGKLVDFNLSDNHVVKLLRKPNKHMSWYDFIYLMQVMYELYDEVYIYKLKDKFGRVVELYIIPSFLIEPIIEDNLNIVGFQSTEYADSNITYSVDDIIYDFNPSPKDYIRGESKLKKILTEIDIHFFAKEFARLFYKNGAVPHGVLTTDQVLNDRQIEKIKADWKNKLQGMSKAWDIAILHGGLKYEKISIEPSSEEFIKQSKWTREDIASIFKVPPIKLGYVEGITKATAQTQERIFASDCIYPRLIKLQYLLNEKLIPSINKTSKKILIEFKSPLPEDEELAIQKAKVSGTFGLATINEMRQLLGLEKLEGEYAYLGDMLVEPLNNPQGRPNKEDEGTPVADVDSNPNSKILSQIDNYIEDILSNIRS